VTGEWFETQIGGVQMSAMVLSKVFGVMVVSVFAIDLLWISVVANRFYQKHLGFLLRPDVQWAPAVLFYLLFVAGVLVFAVLPGVERGSLGRALALGAFLGLVAFATYDLTNLALTRGFPTIVALVDLAWGMTIAATTAAIGYGAALWFEG